jgi:glycosyltransferase involved in cell wall biosynthesis
MKTLFIHTSHFVRLPNGEVYNHGQYPYWIWERYLKHFDEINVLGRVVDADLPPNGWNLSSGKGVNFIGIPDDQHDILGKIYNKNVRKIILNAIINSDAVIIRTSRIAWYASKYAHKKNKPWAIEVVGDSFYGFWYHGGIIGKIYAIVSHILAKKWIHKAPYVLYVTKDYLQYRYPNRNKTIGVSNIELNPLSDIVLKNRLIKIDKSFGSNQIFKCAIIGDLTANYKGLDVILKAMKLLKDRNITIELHNIGNGNLDSYFKLAEKLGIRELFKFDGSRESGKPVLDWLDNMDFYVQPSRTEGMPRALIEAMSRGLPCFASNVGGIPELIEEELLHKPGDFHKLAQDIELLLSSKGLFTARAERNFEHAKNFSNDSLNQVRDEFWSSFANFAMNKTS